jgi:hypothetical protein
MQQSHVAVFFILLNMKMIAVFVVTYEYKTWLIDFSKGLNENSLK